MHGASTLLKHLYMEFLTVFVRNSKNISEKISSRVRFVTFVTLSRPVAAVQEGFVTFVTLSRPVAAVQEGFVTFVTLSRPAAMVQGCHVCHASRPAATVQGVSRLSRCHALQR